MAPRKGSFRCSCHGLPHINSVLADFSIGCDERHLLYDRLRDENPVVGIAVMLETIARMDVLVVDDFAMAPLNEQERRDFRKFATTATIAAPPS